VAEVEKSGMGGCFGPKMWIPSIHAQYCLATKMHGRGCTESVWVSVDMCIVMVGC